MRFSSLIAMVSLALCSYAAPQLTGNMRTTDTAKSGQNQPRSNGEDSPFIAEFLYCTQDSDCAIRNVGNCCGYYPMCANTWSELPLPCTNPDRASVCGFPAIDKCKCGSRGGCMSLLGDKIVHGSRFDDSPTCPPARQG